MNKQVLTLGQDSRLTHKYDPLARPKGITINKSIKNTLEKQHYSVFGHSAVQICGWTKKSLRDENFCYKQKFYGIESHKCCQMSCWLACQNSCLHCWRAIELDFKKFIDNKKIDEPKKIIENCILAQRKLLSGFGGSEKTNMKKLREAKEPKHFAISLIGEATLYPRLTELIKELRKQGKTSFLVSNGLVPEKLKELQDKNALPTQIYISLLYPNEKLFRKITKNKNKKAWRKFNETLELLKNLNTRTVIRLTLARGLNMEKEYAKNYAELIEKASPLFIEVKGYRALGFSKQRLGHEKMPHHKEVKEFSEKLLKFLPEYDFLDEKKESFVVLLGKDKSRMKIKESEI